MVSRNPLVLGLLAVLVSSANLICAQDADAKGKKRSSAKNYFVPPPPAYTPSLTPAVYVNGKAEVAQKPKKKEPEKKYVYTREGYEEPKATRPNPYVTYWGS